MKIPLKNFKVKVGAFEYEVIYSKDTANEGDAFGSTHNGDQKIFLDPTLKKQKIEQTFLHEVMHACTFVNGIVYRFAEEDKMPSEEEVIKALSMTLYGVIKDNPKLFL